MEPYEERTICTNGCGAAAESITPQVLHAAGWLYIPNIGRICPRCRKMNEMHGLPLTETRRGQIALMFLKFRFRQDGVRIGHHTKRELGSTAKELGILVEEAMAFVEMMVRELVEETFPKAGSGFKGGVSNTDT